jgi:hypothetical protein
VCARRAPRETGRTLNGRCRRPRFRVAIVGALFFFAPGASASPFQATLTFYFLATETVFTASGDGYNTKALVTLPAGLFSGTATNQHTTFTKATVSLGTVGPGVFSGSPLAGPMPVPGRFHGLDGSGHIRVPLRGLFPVAGTFGVSGSARTFSYDSPLTAYFVPWIAAKATPSGAGGNFRYEGSDARTPEGRGRITLVSPTRVRAGAGAGLSFYLVGRLEVEFVPEPGAPLLLGTGAALLWALGGARRGASPGEG